MKALLVITSIYFCRNALPGLFIQLPLPFIDIKHSLPSSNLARYLSLILTERGDNGFSILEYEFGSLTGLYTKWHGCNGTVRTGIYDIDFQFDVIYHIPNDILEKILRSTNS